MYDASAAVLTKGLLNYKPAGWRIIPGYFMTRKQTDWLIFYGSVTTIIIVLKNAIALDSRYHLKQYDQLKWM
jgi:hypothetical protein